MAEAFPEVDNMPLIALLSAINSAMGQPEYTAPSGDLGPERVLTLAESLRTNQYQPKDWFRRGPTRDGGDKLAEPAPALDPNWIYKSVHLMMKNPFMMSRSVGSGGVLFEDPCYALLACYNATLGKPRFVFPFARTYQDMWKRRKTIIQSVREKTYRPETHYAEAEPNGGDQAEPLRLQPISGAQLRQLRESGAAVLLLDKKRGMAEYLLFYLDLSP